MLSNTVAFVRSTIVKSAPKAPIISLFAVFYKMTEKNWRGMYFILWPLYASNVCHRILGFVLLWCLAGEGTCLSLFSAGTAGSISLLHSCSKLALCKCCYVKLSITLKLKRVEILSKIYLKYNISGKLIYQLINI